MFCVISQDILNILLIYNINFRYMVHNRTLMYLFYGIAEN